MFWKKKKVLKTTPYKESKFKNIKVNNLFIQTKSSAIITWKVEPWEGTIKIEPWLNFYKWFFGRSGDFFVMKYDKGETMIRRDEIIAFSVVIDTKNVIDKD